MGGKLMRLRSQRGFTLIELLAVMAIIAILAAIVAPAVSGTKDNGVEAQAGQDAMQVRTAANDYFSDQNAVEVLSSEAITSVGVALPTSTEDGTTFVDTETDSSTTTISATQKTSSRWPEKFITASATSTAIYYTEFALSSSNDLNEAWVLDFDDEIIGGADLFTNYTAIDIDEMRSPKEYLTEEPKSADLTVTLGSTNVHTVIWLFKKTTSPDSPTDDGREVLVFKLAEAKKVSVPNGTLPALTKYDLTYRRVF